MPATGKRGAMISLKELTERLATFQPRKHLQRRQLSRAAVSLMIAEGEAGPEVLMIRRAERARDPWSGHMGFPGGRMDIGEDAHVYDCALRETREEIGVDLAEWGEPLGRLSDLQATGHGRLLSMIITPFVFRVPRQLSLEANHEVAEVVWVPLSLFADTARREHMQWQFEGRDWTLPCYFFEGHRIWGLSLQMLDELMALLTRG